MIRRKKEKKRKKKKKEEACINLPMYILNKNLPSNQFWWNSSNLLHDNFPKTSLYNFNYMIDLIGQMAYLNNICWWFSELLFNMLEKNPSTNRFRENFIHIKNCIFHSIWHISHGTPTTQCQPSLNSSPENFSIKTNFWREKKKKL